MESAGIEDVLLMDMFDTFDSSSSSSEKYTDDKMLHLMDMMKAVRKKYRNKMRYYYDDLSDSEFEMRFRLPRDMVDKLVAKIQHKIQFPEYRYNSISPRLQVLITLRCYVTGAFQSVIGDLFGVSQKSVSWIIENVSSAIAGLAAEEVRFPETREEMTAMNQEFFKIAKMLLVIGVIDGKMQEKNKINIILIYKLVRDPSNDRPKLPSKTQTALLASFYLTVIFKLNV